MKRVLILMSAYNGEKYLAAQLDSIFAQTYPEVSLLVRDDGSTDATGEILNTYAKRYPAMQVMQGDNIGVWQSFFVLFQKASGKADYYALADQDDVWLEDKITTAVAALEGLEKNNPDLPALYAGEKRFVDEQLAPICSGIDNTVRGQPSFGNALVENICTGCTCVMNRQLLELVCRCLPSYVRMHDWWLYLTASAFGKVIYDRTPQILYRQHPHNAHGTIMSRRRLYLHRFRELTQKREGVYRQLEEFKRIYRLPEESAVMLERVLDSRGGLRKKLCLLQDRRIGRQGKGQRTVYLILVLLGKL